MCKQQLGYSYYHFEGDYNTNYDETELRGDLCATRWGKKSISSKRSHLKNSFDSDDTVTATVNTIFSVFKNPFGFQTHNSTLR